MVHTQPHSCSMKEGESSRGTRLELGGSEQSRQAEVKLGLRSEPEAGGQGGRTVGDSLPS